MAKKRPTVEDLEDVDLTFDPNSAARKLPMDISQGKEVLMEYMEIPISSIEPFQNKRNCDFSEYDDELSTAMVDSIRQYGVMEAITVRKKEDGRYELLAGERRWRHAEKAGLTKIPAHVIRADEDVAQAVFSLTNLLRRPVSFRDLIYGWWMFYSSIKESGKLSELRELSPENFSPEAKAEMGLNGQSISYRQMMRYVRMHNLIPDWVDALEAKQTTLRAAEVIAGLTPEQQADITPLISEINEEKAKLLLQLSRGKIEKHVWGQEGIRYVLDKKRPRKTKSAQETAFKKARPKILKAAMSKLKIEDYDRAEEVINKALELYYAQKEG